jgi:hypothetical protein
VASQRTFLQASVRTQLIGAAVLWLIGASILLVRGVSYVQGRSWHVWVLAIGLVLGVLKARVLLDGVATRAVARIRHRGRASFFGFFSARSWALVALMMGGGILLRRLIVQPVAAGAGILGAVYIGVGTALLLADRIFWLAVFKPAVVPDPEAPLDPATAEDESAGPRSTRS